MPLRYLDQPHHGLTSEQKQDISTETLAVLNREEMAKLLGLIVGQKSPLR